MYRGEKILAYISVYESYVEEMKQLGYEASLIAKKINDSMQNISELSTEDTAKVLYAIEEMKITHAEFISALTDYKII